MYCVLEAQAAKHDAYCLPLVSEKRKLSVIFTYFFNKEMLHNKIIVGVSRQSF